MHTKIIKLMTKNKIEGRFKNCMASREKLKSLFYNYQ